MLPRDAASRPLSGAASRGRGPASWSGGSLVASLLSGSGGNGASGNGNGGRAAGASSSAAAAAARRRHAHLFNAALAAACVALVVTAASLRELRALVRAQRQQQGQSGADYSGGHGGGWAAGAAASLRIPVAPPPPRNVPGALLSGSSHATAQAAQPASAAAQAAAAAAPAPAPALDPATATACAATAMPATEMWGDVVRWGASHRVDSAAACCSACRAHEPGIGGGDGAASLDCNVWVWCGDAALCGAQHRECWLKHLAHPSVARPMREGAGVGWTSGIVDRAGEMAGGEAGSGAPPPVGVAAELERAAAAADKGGQGGGGGGDDDAASRRYHTVTTAQGPAVHWQTRVHYYHFLKQKAACEAEAAARRKKEGAKAAGCDMGGWTRLLHSGEADDLMDELPTFLADPLPESVVPHAW
jgi:hypothetical protein